jgi:hypothetical protein
MFVMSTLLVLVWSASAQAQKARAVVSTAPVVTQQPPYSDYKGVRLGMTAQEVRTKLGAPTMKSDEQDYFVLSDKETAQVAYDAAGKVKVISVDYMGGIGAPDYRTIVGADPETRPGEILYKVVRYENQGFWVSYYRTAGPVIIVTITIQKIL